MEYYLEVRRQLREAIRQKRTELWKNKSCILHHDNPSTYTSTIVYEFLAENKIVTMSQPPYSPDMVPADFFFFPKLKIPMKGKRFTMSCWWYQKARFINVSRIEKNAGII